MEVVRDEISVIVLVCREERRSAVSWMGKDVASSIT